MKKPTACNWSENVGKGLKGSGTSDGGSASASGAALVEELNFVAVIPEATLEKVGAWFGTSVKGSAV